MNNSVKFATKDYPSTEAVTGEQGRVRITFISYIIFLH